MIVRVRRGWDIDDDDIRLGCPFYYTVCLGVCKALYMRRRKRLFCYVDVRKSTKTFSKQIGEVMFTFQNIQSIF